MPSKTLSPLEFGEPTLVDRSLSGMVRGLVGSEILRIAGDIRRMVASGQEVCNLTVGDFDTSQFPIPGELADGICRALDAGETNYPPSNGLLSLRKAVADFVARNWGARYPVESVLIASGARPILYAAYRAVVDPGDTIVYPVPSWNNNHYTWMSRGKPVLIETRPEDGFMPTLEQLAPHIESARMICLNSPLNPAGTVISEQQLKAILEAVVEENRRRTRTGRNALFLLHDQVYATLVFGAARHSMPVTLVPESAPWVITLDGISKSFAATGLRVGWLLAAPELTARAKDLLGHVGAWAPRPEQAALAEFLNDEPAVTRFQREMNDRVEARLDALYNGFCALEQAGYPVSCIQPQGAIYLSLNLNLVGRSVGGERLENNEAIRKLLLDRARLAVVPFQAFGLERDTGWFRLSVGAVSLADIEHGFSRLREVLDELD